MTDDGWKGGQYSQAYVDHLKAEAMTDARDIVERLRMAAQSASQASEMLAKAKSRRQHDCVPPREDLYSWATPEQTLEWKAADTIASLRKQLEDAREALIQADLTIRSFKGADQSDVEFIREALKGKS